MGLSDLMNNASKRRKLTGSLSRAITRVLICVVFEQDLKCDATEDLDDDRCSLTLS